MVDEPGSRPPEVLAVPTAPVPTAPVPTAPVPTAPGPTDPGPGGAVVTAAQEPSDGAGEGAEQGDRPLDPEKLLRLAGVVRAVLDEVRQLDPDQATAAELTSLHRRVTAQVEDALPNALRDELQAIDLAPGGNGAEAADQAPAAGATGQEVRFAYAGLIGWLSGLFQGLQAAMQFQQLQAMNALPGGSGGTGGPGGSAGREGGRMDLEPGTGHYL